MTKEEIDKSRKILHKAMDLYFLGEVDCIAEGVEKIVVIEKIEKQKEKNGLKNIKQ